MLHILLISISDTTPKSPRCSKTLEHLYRNSGDGETYLGKFLKNVCDKIKEYFILALK